MSGENHPQADQSGDSLPSNYPALLAAIDAWQAEAKARHPGVIPCRSGCTACCHGPFDISVSDALLVRDAVAALPEELQGELRERAAAQVDRMRELEPGFPLSFDVSGLHAERFDAVVDALEAEPCPALDALGRCVIYVGRPMVCRMMGLGLETTDGAVIENACPIQEEFSAYRALPPQAFDLLAWEEGEALAHQRAAMVLFGTPDRTNFETTVAGAILLHSS